jgi:hypothetical protein
MSGMLSRCAACDDYPLREFSLYDWKNVLQTSDITRDSSNIALEFLIHKYNFWCGVGKAGASQIGKRGAQTAAHPPFSPKIANCEPWMLHDNMGCRSKHCNTSCRPNQQYISHRTPGRSSCGHAEEFITTLPTDLLQHWA